MFRIDPARIDLAREFKVRPFGVHSADLQAVLNYMRTHPAKGNYLLREIAPHRQWMLVEMTGEPPRPRQLANQLFDSLEAAEWHVFKLRWEGLTSAPLAID